MSTHKVRTTINPGTVLTVDDAELTDLKRSGLILPAKLAAKLDNAAAPAEANEAKALAEAKNEGK